MGRTIFGEYSKDRYCYWGYVEERGKMMPFVSREEYLEYISELDEEEPDNQGSLLFGRCGEKS